MPPDACDGTPPLVVDGRRDHDHSAPLVQHLVAGARTPLPAAAALMQFVDLLPRVDIAVFRARQKEVTWRMIVQWASQNRPSILLVMEQEEEYHCSTAAESASPGENHCPLGEVARTRAVRQFPLREGVKGLEMMRLETLELWAESNYPKTPYFCTHKYIIKS